MRSDVLLALGLLFSAFTQLRLSGLPVGIGEACLVLWLAMALGRCVGNWTDPLPRPFVQLATFWLLLTVALSIGQMRAVAIGAARSQSLILHDVLAYGLAAATSLAVTLQPRPDGRIHRTISVLVVAGSFALAIQLLQAIEALPGIGLSYWFYDRFTGWTTNSNQLALLCLTLVTFSLHLAERATRPSNVALALSGAVLPAIAGYLTRSDAFVIACLVGLGGYGAIAARKVGAVLRGPASQSAVALTLLLPAFLVLLTTSMPLIYRSLAERLDASQAAESRERIERDVGYRTALLAQALDRAVESKLLGLGPGPHLNRPESLREANTIAHPDFEAHNTLVDLFLQGGLLAVAALAWLIFVAVEKARATSLKSLAILVIVISVFSLTHNVARHPMVWFVVACALVLPPGRDASSRRHGCSPFLGGDGEASVAPTG